MATKKHYVFCLDNSGYEASLVVHKVYEVIPDPRAEKDNLTRVIDESGEDYLFDSSHFAPIELPAEIERALINA